MIAVSELTRPAKRLLGLAKTLETHSGFADVVASLRAGHGGTIGGTWGSSSALTAAALARGLEAGDAPGVLVVVLPHADEADAFADDLALFTTPPMPMRFSTMPRSLSTGPWHCCPRSRAFPARLRPRIRRPPRGFRS